MNDRSRPDDQIVDDDLRRAYRRSAKETVPDHLDRRVLAEAERATETGPDDLNRRASTEAEYAAALERGRRWPAFRPLAWAATVGLSLVLVMQLTTLGPEPPAAPEAADDAAANRPAFEVLTDEIDETAPAAISPAEKRERLEKSITMSAPAADSRRATDRQENGVAAVAEQESAAHGAERQAPGVAPVSSDVARTTRAYCDDERTRDPEDWRRCIEELLETGHRDRAVAEHERYREAFPEAPAIDF